MRKMKAVSELEGIVDLTNEFNKTIETTNQSNQPIIEYSLDTNSVSVSGNTWSSSGYITITSSYEPEKKELNMLQQHYPIAGTTLMWAFVGFLILLMIGVILSGLSDLAVQYYNTWIADDDKPEPKVEVETQGPEGAD